ncbi:MAG TPA: hypothetical protein VL200_10540 [Lacunisphaera sp.]|jgi:hypothetical protein|nr:hypothetical protein [Lacunisphaera sp.]
MKPAGLSLLALLATAGWADEPAAPPALARTSDRLRQEIRTTLPKYVAPPVVAPVATPAAVPPPPPDPDVFVLPTLTIKEKRPSSHDPDVWLSDHALRQKALVAYRTSMTDLEWALNSWFIPLFSAPPSVRARAYYHDLKLRDEIDRLHRVINAIGLTDRETAAKLKDAMDPRKLPKEN